MNRTQNTDQTRGGILVRFAEETIIEGNEIMPTFIYGAGSSTIPHIYLDPRSLNTRIGHNSYRGRHVFPGSLYGWYAPIINTTNLPQYEYPNATSDGGLKTVQKRLRLEWLLPAATLTAPLGETYAFIPGTTLVNYHSLTRSVWLTNIQAILPAGMSAGTFTVKVYNRENDAGSLFLIKEVTATPEAGIQFALLNQHPYIDKLLPGTVLVTVETSAAFAPTASNEIYIELEFEEFDNH